LIPELEALFSDSDLFSSFELSSDGFSISKTDVVVFELFSAEGVESRAKGGDELFIGEPGAKGGDELFIDEPGAKGGDELFIDEPGANGGDELFPRLTGDPGAKGGDELFPRLTGDPGAKGGDEPEVPGANGGDETFSVGPVSVGVVSKFTGSGITGVSSREYFTGSFNIVEMVLFNSVILSFTLFSLFINLLMLSE